MRPLLPLLALALATTTVRATLTLSFDFDSLADGVGANALATPQFSFHSAVLQPRLGDDGLEIPGSDRWTFTDDFGPVTVADLGLWPGWGPAPSGANALNAFDGPVFLKFDQTYRLDAFSAALDLSPFGDLGTSQILFVSDNAILATLDFEATVPGAILSAAGVEGVTGIVLPGGSFYDNIAVTATPVPEPSTYGLAAVFGLLALVCQRRWRGRRRT